MRRLITSAILSFLAVFPVLTRGVEDLQETEKAPVIEFASSWFSRVNAGDFASAYPDLSSTFREKKSLTDWSDDEKKFMEIAGKPVEQEKLTIGRWERDPAGIAPGLYFQIYAGAKFERIDRFRMAITLRVEKGGKIQILSYERWYIDRSTEQSLRTLQRKFDGARFPSEKVTKEELDRYYTEIMALSGWHGFPKGDTYVIQGAESDTGYIFTAPSHPAHPAVIKLREMVYAGTKGVMKSGHFAGDEEAYRKWLASVGPQKKKE